MTSLTSAGVPDVGPGDHVRGEGPETILYLDLACQHCAATWARISPLPLRLVFRHFPVASKHPRAPALHAAAEAVTLQGGEEAFWGLVDSIYRDQGRWTTRTCGSGSAAGASTSSASSATVARMPPRSGCGATSRGGFAPG